MNFSVDKNSLNMAPAQLARRAGYAYFRDPKSGEESFVRRPYGGFYPRFHLYISENESKAIFNLHLDQKQASYPGARKHNADYDGAAVEEEIDRLKQFILGSLSDNSGSTAPAEKEPWYKF